MTRVNFIHTLRTTLCAALSLGLVACTGIDNETVGESESETGASSTGTTGESASSTSGASTDDTDGTEGGTGGGTAVSTTDEPTSTEGDTTGDDSTSTGGTTGATSTTGGGADSIPESCEQACEVVFVCLADEYESMEACVAECIEETTPDEPSPECEAAVVDVNLCIAGGTCEEFEGEEFCESQVDAMIELCDFDGEICSVGIGGDSESCGIIEECGEGSTELRCEGDSCLCLVDEEEVGSCKNDVCVDELDPSVLYDKALTCCGFEF